MNGLQKHRSGLWYRPGTSDLATFSIVRRDYKALPIRAGDVVLDLGANIGVFTAYALENGADYVVAVEPEPANIALWRHNQQYRKWSATLCEGAIGMVEGQTTLYVSKGRGKDSHSLHTKGLKQPLSVKHLALGELVGSFKPQVVKCDIEYSEYDLMPFWIDRRGWPIEVRAIAVEFHLSQKGRKEQAAQAHQGMLRQGFRAVKAPVLHTGAWNTLAIYTRS